MVDPASADQPLAADGFASAEAERDRQADADAAFPDAGAEGETTADASADALPQEIPARQQVIFRVTNGSSAVRYLAVSGQTFAGSLCSPYAVIGPAGDLALALPYACGCECPAPPEPGITALWRLAPGETKDLIWDARALVTRKELVPCTWNGQPTPSATVVRGVWQPVAPGRYQATLIGKASIPSRFQESKGSVYPVDGKSWSEAPRADIYTSAGICDTINAIQASFELPPEGDVVVPVTL